MERRVFYRRAALLSEPFSAGWLAALAMVVIGAVWIGLFAYRHVDYSSERVLADLASLVSGGLVGVLRR